VTTRDAIVAALGSVPGIAASPTQPSTIVAGMAWPVWRATTWRNQVRDGARELSWYAVVVLPAGSLEATVAEADPIVEAIGQALADAELGVLSVGPTNIAVANGGDPIPALRYTLGDR
jgi:hypothetical protein